MRKSPFHVHVTIPNLCNWKCMFSTLVHQSALINRTMILFYYRFMRKLRIIGVFLKNINHVILWCISSLNCCPTQIQTYNNTTRDLYYFSFIALSIISIFLLNQTKNRKLSTSWSTQNQVRCAIRNNLSRKWIWFLSQCRNEREKIQWERHGNKSKPCLSCIIKVLGVPNSYLWRHDLIQLKVKLWRKNKNRPLPTG